MTGQVVAFRISNTEYAKLTAYAKENNITVSEAVRRAVKWMLILQQGRSR